MSRSNQLAGLLTADPPSALDTINEINTALGNDAALSTTLTNSIATKMPLAGGTFTGNVGINSTSPSSQLSIGETSGTPIFTIGRAGTNPIITAGGNNTDLKVSAVGSGGGLHLDTNGSTRLSINASGNVGIGTTSPSMPLHVYSSENNLMHLQSTDQDALFKLSDNGGHFTINTANNNTSLGANGRAEMLRFSGTTAIVLNEDGLDQDFRVESDNDANAFFVEGSTGNIGIGDSPTSITNHKVLELKNTATNGRATLALTANNAEYSNLYLGDSDDIDVGGIQYYHGTNVMDFYVAGSSRLNIDASGTLLMVDANSGSQQSTQHFKIGRATIQVANVNTTSATNYGAGFTFTTYDYNGSSFVNHDALRITARGDVVVAHDNYIHGSAHTPVEVRHGTSLFKTNGDFVQTGGDYDPRSGTSQTLFTPYYRRAMVSNEGRNTGSTNDMWYMWYKITGVDSGYSSRSTPYVELRVVGHSGHHSGSISRVIMVTPASNDPTCAALTASQMGKSESSKGYGQTLNVLLYGNIDSSNEMYIEVQQGQREGHVSIFADLYSCTRNAHSMQNFSIIYYGGGTASSTEKPGNTGSGRATFNN